ncbi:glycosyltransferase family 2 protein [Mucilaginibacter flavidus]|uniref:glycosyltransferase family 2 protein n=1 Tax=Mucilaginibacter flavidus TaxID=2949309 RepID=UPI0020931CFC|nr:glycosyltransferase family 2 protein [Mucilaginibacter flavidus]MCO5947680.1 glycosyltransferase family 2 protein [Mucilaginibacter flavidus]
MKTTITEHNVTPLVSICMPAYNCEKYIGETLRCLCAQTYPSIEIIVVDDGSTDATILKIKNVEDTRITCISVANTGASGARNIAYGHSKGQYIIFFDADDFVKPDFVTLQLKKINNRCDVIVLSAWGRFYNDNIGSFNEVPIPYEEMVLEEWISYYWYNSSPMTTPGRALVPKKLIEKAGLWNETLSLNDDLEFYTRLFIQAEKIMFNHDAFFYYRSGIDGLSSKKGLSAYQSLFDSVRLSTELVLKEMPYTQSVRQGCANLWQSFVYEVYPREQQMVKIAEHKIRELGGAKIPYPSGGYTKFAALLIGWKLTKMLKQIFNDA